MRKERQSDFVSDDQFEETQRDRMQVRHLYLLSTQGTFSCHHRPATNDSSNKFGAGLRELFPIPVKTHNNQAGIGS